MRRALVGEILRTWLPLRLRRALHRLGIPKADHLLTLDQAGALAASLVAVPPWSVDHVGIEGSQVVARGWLLRLGDGAPLELRLDDKPFTEVSLYELRPDIRSLYTHITPNGDCGFTVKAPLLTTESAQTHRITAHRAGESAPISLGHVFSFTLGYPDFPIPEPGQMRRVSGGDQPAAFLSGGYDVFRKLADAAERACPGLWQRPHVQLLDCGDAAADASRGISRHYRVSPSAGSTWTRTTSAGAASICLLANGRPYLCAHPRV